ncbi:hypothetical protein [Streptomyces noursei]|uniref:hypothetical protein n=1 Tax=Streptomyces noursei TaxID=1971 RepID=UPI000C9BD36F|nr:hypothetical protein [Streptomyces noursei]
MTVRAAWLLPTGQTREDTRLAPLGAMAPTSELASRDGVIAGGNPLAAAGVGPMQLQIGTGRALVQGTTPQGAYPVAVTSPETLTLADGDAQYGRIDAVVLRVRDGLYDTSEQTTVAVEVIQGAPSATPTAPALPPAALRLWEVTVPAGTSAGTGGITWGSALADRRRYTAAYGGIIPRGWGLNFPGAHDGQYRDTGTSLERWNASAGAWQPYPADTGWTDLPLPTGYQRFSGNAYPLQIRRTGAQVHLRGRITRSAGPIPADGQPLPGLTLPAAYRPSQSPTSYAEVLFGCDVTSTYPAGVVRGEISGRGTITPAFQRPVSSWLAFGCSWWTD